MGTDTHIRTGPHTMIEPRRCWFIVGEDGYPITKPLSEEAGRELLTQHEWDGGRLIQYAPIHTKEDFDW